MEKVKECLVPSCDSHEFSRGLCRGHYQNARRLIKRGETTWAKLESLGKALPRKNRERSATKFFLDEEKRIQE